MTLAASNPHQKIDSKRGLLADLIDEWQELRQALRELEVAEHPDITDALGRVWAWESKGLYIHDKMAWPREWVLDPNVGLPKQRALDNPNYQWCTLCKPIGEVAA